MKFSQSSETLANRLRLQKRSNLAGLRPGQSAHFRRPPVNNQHKFKSDAATEVLLVCRSAATRVCTPFVSSECIDTHQSGKGSISFCTVSALMHSTMMRSQKCTTRAQHPNSNTQRISVQFDHRPVRSEGSTFRQFCPDNAHDDTVSQVQ